MDAGPSRRLNRAAKWLAVLACIGLLMAELRTGSSGDFSWWLLSISFMFWQAGPILLAAACAHASPSVAGQTVFLGLAGALILYCGYENWGIMISSNSTASLALVFYPLFAYGAWIVVFVFACLLGWRHRRDWLRG
jgi:hypothetical protein